MPQLSVDYTKNRSVVALLNLLILLLYLVLRAVVALAGNRSPMLALSQALLYVLVSAQSCLLLLPLHPFLFLYLYTDLVGSQALESLFLL
jgi:hypothetical protein